MSWLAGDVQATNARCPVFLLQIQHSPDWPLGCKGSRERARRWPLQQQPHLPGWQYVHECATGTYLTPVRCMASGPSTGTATSRGTTRIRPMSSR